MDAEFLSGPEGRRFKSSLSDHFLLKQNPHYPRDLKTCEPPPD